MPRVARHLRGQIAANIDPIGAQGAWCGCARAQKRARTMAAGVLLLGTCVASVRVNTFKATDRIEPMKNDQSDTNSRSKSDDQQVSDGVIAAKSHETAEQVKSVARERVEQVRKIADDARQTAGEKVQQLAETVRWIGGNLRHEDQAFIAGYADAASDRLAELASYIESSDTQDLVHDVQTFARRKPGYFFGGAVLLGLAAGRFLRSSSSSMSRPRSDASTSIRKSARAHREVPMRESDGEREVASRAHSSDKQRTEAGKQGPHSTSPSRRGAQGNDASTSRDATRSR
jgi:hypothetical protein